MDDLKYIRWPSQLLAIRERMLRQPNWPEGHTEKVPVLIERLAANAEFEILLLVWQSGW